MFSPLEVQIYRNIWSFELSIGGGLYSWAHMEIYYEQCALCVPYKISQQKQT